MTMENIIKDIIAVAALLALGHMLRNPATYATMEARVDAAMKTEAINEYLDAVEA